MRKEYFSVFHNTVFCQGSLLQKKGFFCYNFLITKTKKIKKLKQTQILFWQKNFDLPFSIEEKRIFNFESGPHPQHQEMEETGLDKVEALTGDKETLDKSDLEAFQKESQERAENLKKQFGGELPKELQKMFEDLQLHIDIFQSSDGYLDQVAALVDTISNSTENDEYAQHVLEEKYPNAESFEQLPKQEIIDLFKDRSYLLGDWHTWNPDFLEKLFPNNNFSEEQGMDFVKHFQEILGVRVDGKFGPQTRYALLQVYGVESSKRIAKVDFSRFEPQVSEADAPLLSVLQNVSSFEGNADSVNLDDVGGVALGMFQFHERGELSQFIDYLEYTDAGALEDASPELKAQLEKVQNGDKPDFASVQLQEELREFAGATEEAQVLFKIGTVKQVLKKAKNTLDSSGETQATESILADKKGLTLIVDIQNQAGTTQLLRILRKAHIKNRNSVAENLQAIADASIQYFQERKINRVAFNARLKRNQEILTS